jgi:hypothetical protein
MLKDPVVEEVRAIRDEYARRFDYDIEAICRDLRAQEASGEHEVVSLPPKRIAPTEAPPDPKGKAA